MSLSSPSPPPVATLSCLLSQSRPLVFPPGAAPTSMTQVADPRRSSVPRPLPSSPVPAADLACPFSSPDALSRCGWHLAHEAGWRVKCMAVLILSTKCHSKRGKVKKRIIQSPLEISDSILFRQECKSFNSIQFNFELKSRHLLWVGGSMCIRLFHSFIFSG
jgi:hypothetical protein